MKISYTYEEAIKLIKKSIAKTHTTKKSNLMEHGDIAEFCKKNELEYYTVVNCLNSKSEKYPKLVKKILEILLKTKEIQHKKQNIYFIGKI